MNKKLKFIDLFSGLGGFRIGFEKACLKNKIKSTCILSSEIKEHAIKTYKKNFINHPLKGDINNIKNEEIEDFDVLLAGFPCQSFSSAGSRKGFLDTRGTLFFQIERILKAKKPAAFILENVEGLVRHDMFPQKKPIGRTLDTIIKTLENLGYKISWQLLNSKNFGLAQDRNRIFIVGTKKHQINLSDFKIKKNSFKIIQESIKDIKQTEFEKNLIKKFNVKDLYGKSIKDKRGGINNIHSWDLELKGKVNNSQKKLLELLLRQRRRKVWAQKKNIDWMDGIALTLEDIMSFLPDDNLFEKKINKKDLKNNLDDLVRKGYLAYEHPKKRIKQKYKSGYIYNRIQDTKLKKGYNIVVGKLSFEISKILDPNGITPTLLATDMSRIAVIDNKRLRKIDIKEGLALFGFPKKYRIDLKINESYNLLGESIAVPVVEYVSRKVLEKIISDLH